MPQEGAQSQPAVPKVKLASQEQTLADLLDTCAALLGTPIIYSPVEVQGTVMLRLPSTTTAEALWDLANDALVSRGLTSIQEPESDALQVVPLGVAAGLARVEDFSVRHTRAGFVKVLVQPEALKAEALAEAIKLVLSKAGVATALHDPSALVIADLRPHVLQALHLVAILDTAKEPLSVEEVRVERTSPLALAALIERLVNAKKALSEEKARGTVLAYPEGKSVLVIAPPNEHAAWKKLIADFDQAQQVTTVNYTPRRFGVRETAKLIEQVVFGGLGPTGGARVVVDDLTGTLVVTATPADHLAIGDLMARLESTEFGQRRMLRSFPIKNRSVKDVAGLLERLLEQGILDETDEVKPAEPVQGATTTMPAKSGSAAPPLARATDKGAEVTLTADESTNRLIAFGEGRALEQIARLIETLDLRATQVMVETMVVTLTDTQTMDLAVELQALGPAGDTFFRLGSLFGFGSPDPSVGTAPPSIGTGFTGIVLNPGDFSALVRALETVNKGRAVNLPKVLVNNHEEARLDSVLQTPYASVNASTTVATTSYGGSIDAGTSIVVRPQIAEGDQLVLDYSVSLSAFVGKSADPNLPPPRQENKLASTATVPDGYTVALGGLEISQDSEGRSQVPLLGDIPLLGVLFQSTTKSTTKSRFFVFIRASVLRSGSFEDLKYLSERETAVAGLPREWPELEPRVIR